MDSDEGRPRYISAPSGMETHPLICMTCFALLPNDERMADAHIARHDREDRRERLVQILESRLAGGRHHRRTG